MKKILNRNILFAALLTVLLVVVLWSVGNLKSGLHVDEVSTFALSNRQAPERGAAHSMHIIDGKVYNGQKMWSEFTSVKQNKRFDYKNVFINQSKDVHPPLFYILFHTVSSLFPEIDKMYIGLIVNIPLVCVIFWQMVWIARKLGSSLTASLLLSVSYVLGAGSVGYNVVFFRMYALFCVFVNFLAMVFLKYKPEEKVSIGYCVAIWLVLLGGAMSQYYFIVYAFFACGIYAIFVLLKKNRLKFVISIITSLISGVALVLIFPATIKHIFEGYRGKQAFSNVSKVGELWEHLWKYFDLIDRNTWGGLFVVFFVVAICLLIISQRKQLSEKMPEYLLIIVPPCFYIMVIVLIAPLQDFRYVVPVLGLVYICTLCGLMSLARGFSTKSGYLILILALVALLIGYRKPADNLYLQGKQQDELTLKYKNSLCMVVMEDKITFTRLRPLMYHWRLLNDIVFMHEKNYLEMGNIVNDPKSLIVFLTKNTKSKHDDILNVLKKRYGMKSYKKLYDMAYGTIAYGIE